MVTELRKDSQSDVSKEKIGINDFYQALANNMKENQMRFVWSNEEQKEFNISKTIFIPFDANDKEDENGYGLYLFLNKIQAPHEVAYCIVATASVILADPKNKDEVALLLHELNLNLHVPGWILDNKNNTLVFKYTFPIQLRTKIPEVYLALIVEAFKGIIQSFPLLKEVIEGKSFKNIQNDVESQLSAS